MAIAPATASGAGGVGAGVQAATPPVSVPSASAATHARDRRHPPLGCLSDMSLPEHGADPRTTTSGTRMLIAVVS